MPVHAGGSPNAVSGVDASESKLREHTPRLDIQGLRAIAVIVVVAFHAGLPIPGGFVGVDIFFVISGFVITGMLLRELGRSNTIRLRSFYARRIKRLVPALTLVLVVTLVLTSLFGSPFDNQQSTTAVTAVGATLMVANYVIFLDSGNYFATPPTNNPLLNTWSLSVEEQFYLVFPAFLLMLWWLARRRSRSERTLVIGLVIAVLVSFGLSITMSYGLVSGPLTDPDWFAFYSSPTRAWEFGVGALAFMCVRSTQQLPSRLASTTWWVGLLGITASCLLITEASVFPGWVAVIPVMSTALMLVGGARPHRGLGLLESSPLVKVGDASYSWYLWHWPLIAFTVMLFPSNSWALVAAALLSLGLAFVTLRFVENPLRFAPSNRRLVVGIGVGSVLLVVVSAAAVMAGLRVGWFSPGIQLMTLQVGAQHRWLAECNAAAPLGQRSPECTWNSDATGPTVYLVGDSMAGSLGEGVLGAATSLDRPLMVGTKGACPFIDAAIFTDGRFDSGCYENVQGSLTWLEMQEPGDVIVSSAVGYVEVPGVELALRPEDDPQDDVSAREDIYMQGLSSAIKRLQSAGHRVHVVLPPPGIPSTIDMYSAWRASECSTLQAIIDVQSCGESRPEIEAVEEVEALYTRAQTAVESNGGSILDPRSEVCFDGVCATNAGNTWLYLDGSHISVEMSRKLTDRFVHLLA